MHTDPSGHGYSCRKPICKHILVHFLSTTLKGGGCEKHVPNSPSMCKDGVPKEESYNSSADSHEASLRGYEATVRKSTSDWRRYWRRNEISTDIQRCFKKGLSRWTAIITKIPPNFFRRQLVRNRIYDRLCRLRDMNLLSRRGLREIPYAWCHAIFMETNILEKRGDQFV